ncbi:MAG TPA: hypothetical protein VJN65_03860, partial [Bacteroidota bacterium]|nr:hypothetical protein [Bacteroidota bacterium]
MRLLKLLCFTVALSSLSLAQIPNPGFENWVADADSNNNPVSWQTSNSYPWAWVDPFTPAHQGNFAMRVRTLDLGPVTLSGVAFLDAGANFTQTPTKFSAWVRSTIMPGDTAIIIIALMKGDTLIAATDSCTFKIDSSYSQYTYLEFPLAIISSAIPDSFTLVITTGLNANPQAGTEIIVDDIAFTGSNPTSVAGAPNLPGNFALAQNYPNPFNPETEIRYQIPAYAGTEVRGQRSEVSRVKLTVCDLLGRTVAVLVDETLPAG